MSEQTSQEPTMEEILASIRRIISEDDAPAEEGAAAPEPAPVAAAEPEPVAAPPAPAPIPEPEPVVEAAVEEEDDLELTDKVETHGDLDVYAAPEPAPAPAPRPAPAPAPSIDNLVSDRVATAAASSFGALSAAIAMPAGGQTLEDVVRELLRPLLQQWLDTNQPSIVQATVEAEVERIARTRAR